MSLFKVIYVSLFLPSIHTGLVISGSDFSYVLGLVSTCFYRTFYFFKAVLRAPLVNLLYDKKKNGTSDWND